MAEKQTILITGGCGFIGTSLVRLLIQSGRSRVVNLDALTYAANPLSLEDLEGHPDYTFVQGNIVDAALVSSLFSKAQPAGVMHLAAESHVDRSIVSAEDFVQTNVVGTYTMLEAARQYWNGLSEAEKQASRFLHVSTDEVFGSLGPEGYFSEETPYAPNSPYAASKAGADHLVRAYHEIENDAAFIAELRYLRKHLQGRPTPVYHARSLSLDNVPDAPPGGNRPVRRTSLSIAGFGVLRSGRRCRYPSETVTPP